MSSKLWDAHKDHTRCFYSHPPLDVGGGKVIYGGRCSSPMIKDADVYVGLDWGMKASKRSYPWNGGYEVAFEITDGQAPKDKVEFRKMIEWLCVQLDEGRKVHVGCIGGHGRTGMVLAALVSVRGTSDDPIQYVRDHYCKKAVESQEQVNFLVKEWGCKPAKPTRVYTAKTTNLHDYFDKTTSTYSSGAVTVKKTDLVDSGTPQRNKETIWTPKISFRVS